MKGSLLKKEVAYGIIVLFLITSIAPVISGSITENDQPIDDVLNSPVVTKKTMILTFYVFGKTTIEKHDVEIAIDDASAISEMFEQLKHEMATYPSSEKTQRLQQEFCTILKEKGVIPKEMSQEELMSLMQPPVIPERHRQGALLPLQNRASEWLCTYVSFGSGASFPIIILPRFIPFLLTPIPRVFLRWSAKEGVTSCGGLASGTGFIAVGEQKGVALGFWGIGFTFSLPPLMNTYGMAGYALYATVNADYIEYYPPNTPPEITGVDPSDGQVNVPLSLSELRFRIEDADGDLMSYDVTTEPDIGSGNGGLKQNGVYSVPIQGLESLTQYTWHIQVTDGKDTVDKICSFITEPVAPLVSNPQPADRQRAVPCNLSELKFTLKDFQGDTMDYTVETSPNIGSGSGVSVHNGTYTIPVSGLVNMTMYHWFINVTDGQHWTRKTYVFETPYPDQFNPFEHGWTYRKKITISHETPVEEFTNFPVLVSIVDADLSQKAQENGDDILFMSTSGSSLRMNYELESFDGASGNLAAWVNIPQLSTTEDTTFYLYYGNSHCLSKQYPEGTWDANYKGVWHMNDATFTTVQDSTAGRHTGSKESIGRPAETPNGKIAEAQNFIESSSLTCSDSDDFSMTNGNSDVPFTLELWMYPTAINNHHDLIAKDGQNTREWIFQYYGYPGYDRFISIMLQDNAIGKYLYAIYYYDFQPDIWYQFTVTYDGSGNENGLTLYFNGEPITWSTTSNNGYSKMQNTNTPLYIGKYNWPDPKHYYGIMDEVRISKGITRSPGWVTTCYTNQVDPASFLSMGPEEPGL